MSFVVGAVSIGGGAALGLGGSYLQSQAMGKAAHEQAEAARYAADLQKQMYDQQRSDTQPWREAGGKALSDLANPDFQRDFQASDMQTDPGYQFRMQEGQKALERSAAAKGGLQSGGTLKSVAQYGQDMASNEFQNAYSRFNSDRDRRFNRLSSIAGVGQTANTQMGQAGQNYANAAGNISMSNANAQGAATIGQANAWANGLNNIGQAAQTYGAMKG
jgi:hypothetical protein